LAGDEFLGDGPRAHDGWEETLPMSGESLGRTNPSLLGRLKRDNSDPQAWGDFVRRYGPDILRWCHTWHLQDADAQDVTQTVLLKLAQKLRTFDYDAKRSFRAYLKTLTRYAVADFLEEGLTGRGQGGSVALEQLNAVEARDDLLTQLQSAFDQELLEKAMEMVRARVEPHTWEAYCLTALDRLSGAEVAAKLNLKIATVFKARSKVQQMLRDQVKHLDTDPEP
jgi:RNA polymerase sigma-70 factor (ECF subfamily)